MVMVLHHREVVHGHPVVEDCGSQERQEAFVIDALVKEHTAIVPTVEQVEARARSVYARKASHRPVQSKVCTQPDSL